MTALYRFGRFELSPATRQLRIDGQPAPLGARAFDVLLALVERRDRLVGKDELLSCVWPGVVVEENNLQVHISALRKLLGQEAIATVSGRGYRFVLETTQTVAPLTVPTPPRADRSISSIAVLPFANLSDDVANEYFADGLAEELLNVLSKIDGLRVSSRTSAFYFKGKDVDLATVAQRLNVATVMEGSVRKSGNHVRITVQLIEVATDSHIWSRTFDRELDDIFAVQDEIARSILSELRASLPGNATGALPSARAAAEVAEASKGRTTNGEALRLFLLGRFYARHQTHEGSVKALTYYERALFLDPGFARCWAAVASVHAAQAGYGGSGPVAEGFQHARAAAERALALEPTLAAAHSVLGWIKMYGDWDWKSAELSVRRALQLEPNNTRVLTTASIVFGNLGRLDEAEALLRRAQELDPLDAVIYRQLAAAQLDASNLDAAEATLSQAIELNERLALAQFTLGMVRLSQGRVPEALAAFRLEVLEDYRLLGITIAQHAQGLRAECAATLDELVARYAAISPCQIAEAHACRGEADLAFDWLEQAYASHDPRLAETTGDSLLRNLHHHSRWRPFLEKLGLVG